MFKNLFVTGASRGLGLSIVNEFIEKEWNVFALVRKEEDALKIKELNPCKIFPIIGDVTNPDTVTNINSLLKKDIKIDLLINNAGSAAEYKPFLETKIDDIITDINVHCIGAIRITKAVLPFMNNNSSIINISSRFGSVKKIGLGELDHIKCSYSYRIAKGAQNMFTQCLSRELKDSGIKICSLHPGKLKTALASIDADHEPYEAAKKIFELKDKIKNGKFYSLFEGEIDL